MKIILAAPYQYLESEIRSVPKLFETGEGELVYAGRNTLRRFLFQGVPVMVKRFKRANPVQQIAYTFFRKTKAERAFLYAKAYRKRGIRTPEEIAYIEEQEHGLFTVGYFVCIASPDARVFDALVPVADYDRLLASGLAAQIVQMHNAGILHKDLNLGNFLYHLDKDSRYVFTVLDINRTVFVGRDLGNDDMLLKNLCTITVRQDLFEYIIDAYLRARCWEAKEIKLRIFRFWQKEQKRQARKQKMKQLFKYMKHDT